MGWAGAAGALVLALAAASPARAQEASDFVGVWAAVQHEVDVEIWIDLRLTDGSLGGSVYRGSDDLRAGGRPIDAATLEGSRLTLTVAPQWEGGPAGRLVLDRRAPFLVIVEGDVDGRVPHHRMRRYDRIWARSQTELLDMGSENDRASTRYYASLVLAVGRGLRAAGHGAPDDDAQALCALEVVADAFEHGMDTLRARAVADALGRAAGSGTICGRDLDELTIEGLADGRCYVAVVADSDGDTTVRARPSSRAEAVRTIDNGQRVRVWEAQGRWWRVSHTPAGWVWSANVRCLR